MTLDHKTSLFYFIYFCFILQQAQLYYVAPESSPQLGN